MGCCMGKEAKAEYKADKARLKQAKREEDSAAEVKQAKADLKQASSNSARKAEEEYWKEKKKSGAFKDADG